MANLDKHFDMGYFSDVPFVELDGPGGVYEVKQRPGVKLRAKRDHDADWKRERAMQAGMAFGCQGYNDEMGY